MSDSVSLRILTEVEELPDDPLEIFDEWFQYVKKKAVPQYNAMTLATVSLSGYPNARVVLLKHYDKNGFVFFSNYQSQKARELAEVEKACLVFYWHAINRQVRIRGQVKKISSKASQIYFSSRPRESQIGAIASKQSQPLKSRAYLKQRFIASQKELSQTDDIPCPDYWGGYCLKVCEIEFWINGQNRLHDRFLYLLDQTNNTWQKQRLYP